MNNCKQYQSLASLTYLSSGSPLNICIVTPDLAGPINNGGIGTACAYLAYTLCEAGNRVQIVFTPQGENSSDTAWKSDFEKKGINITIIDTDKERKTNYFPGNRHLLTSLLVYEWLSRNDHFDLVIFMDLHGNGFYSLHAKRSGLKFKNIVMLVIIHSPSLWHCMNNASVPTDPAQSCTWHMERSCIEMADAVISPSQYMLNWCAEHGFKIPEHAYVQPNIMIGRENKKTTKKLDEVVFFGRLEYRKGIEQFCSSLDILGKENRLPAKITFLGKCAWVGNEHSISYIARRSKLWKSDINLLIDYPHQKALDYFLEGGRFAVMPSVADNSPYTVYECLALGIPFLARDTGGVKELITMQDRSAVLFSDNPCELAEKIANIITNSPASASLAFDLNKNTKAWVGGLSGLVQILKDKAGNVSSLCAGGRDPVISVCVIHHNRPRLLKQCIGSLLTQTYKNFEVILADDGSDDTDALAFLRSLEPEFEQRGWSILHLKHGYAGHARNMAAAKARGNWLLFIDDDNVAMPYMLETFASVAKYRDSDLIVSSFYVFDSMDLPEAGKERFLPAGDIIAYSVIANTISDTTSLINKATFSQMDGFSEDYGIGHEDYELFLRFVLAGKDITIIPDALFWYRRNENKDSVQLMTNPEANYMRSMRPFMDILPAKLAEMAMMTHGMGVKLECFPAITGNKDNPAIITAPEREASLDPQSNKVLRQVFLYLEEIDNGNLASQVAAKIEASNPQMYESLKLMSCARESVKCGDVDALKKCLKLYQENRESLHGKKLCVFYISLLAQARKKSPYLCQRLLIDKLNKYIISDIDMALLISQNCLYINDMRTSLIYFFKALNLAEDEYKNERKDVANAIDDGIFFCSLQHYALYGKKENTIWPYKKMFSELLSQSQDFLSKICLAHMNIYKYNNRELVELMFNALEI